MRFQHVPNALTTNYYFWLAGLSSEASAADTRGGAAAEEEEEDCGGREGEGEDGREVGWGGERRKRQSKTVYS